VSAAIVTGGSAGIGRAVVQKLLESGSEVVSLDMKPFPEAHPKLRQVVVDLTDSHATRRVGEEIVRTQQVTTLIHNAGTIRPALLPQVKLEDLEALVNLHLSAALLLLQATLPAMKAAGFGRVVLVSSRAVLGLPTRAAYAATKVGMLGMARTWALELAPEGITVNVVRPRPDRDRQFLRRRAARQGASRAHRAVDPGEASRSARRRGARGSLLRRPGQRLPHRPGAVRLRRHQRGEPGPLAGPPARAAPAGRPA
jgi:3-oxoacyl-[acyl-carrier protein] reductase